MRRFDRTKVSDIFETILREKFGAYYDWEKPTVVKTVGPYDPEAFTEFDNSLDCLLAESFKTLQNATARELGFIKKFDPNDTENVRKEWQAFLRQEISTLDKKRPAWAAGGFGNPNFAADFVHWARMPNLSLSEAVSLSVGVEPRYLGGLLDRDEEDLTIMAEPFGFAKRRAELFKRQFTLFQPYDRIEAKALLEWVKAVELEIHPETLQALERFHGIKGDASSAPETYNRPDKRELNSIASLFTAMAIEQFGYDPKAKRSPTVKEIQNLAASMGITISDDTIRSYLKLGAKFINPEWKPHTR